MTHPVTVSEYFADSILLAAIAEAFLPPFLPSLLPNRWSATGGSTWHDGEPAAKIRALIKKALRR